MRWANVTDWCPTDALSRRRVAESYVGHLIRIDRKDRWKDRQWAVITMVVPSQERLCWLIEYHDGSPDVIQIFDNTIHFDLSETSTGRVPTEGV